MHTLCILGAGPFGRTAATLINTSHIQLLAYGDNNPKLHGTFIHDIPVLPVEEVVQLNPSAILLGVMGKDRCIQLKEQALTCGFTGQFFSLDEFYHTLDIRSATLCRLADRVKELQVAGAIAELGVYKGDTACKLNALFPDRKLYLFDTFEGFDDRDVAQERTLALSRAENGDFSDTSEGYVLSRLPFPEQAIVRKGYFPQTAEGLCGEHYAFVSLDADLYAPILAGLEYFYPRLNKGGMIVLHDYNNERFRGAKQAVIDYEKAHGTLALVTLPDLHGSAVIVKY